MVGQIVFLMLLAKIGNINYKFREIYLPDQVIGDFDSIRSEVFDYYKNKKVKVIQRLDTDTSDLEKCLYVSLEKISTFEIEGEDLHKIFSIIILGASGGRIDHTFSVFSQVFKYLLKYPDLREKAEFILLSKSSCSVYLKPGLNLILTSSLLENRQQGYSLIPIDGKAVVKVSEDSSDFIETREINFSESLFFRKNHEAKKINVYVGCEKNIALLYSFTTCYA
jgi:thiamine pyrophosphokinase